MSASPAAVPPPDPAADHAVGHAADHAAGHAAGADELARLRAELDRLDDVLHDALMARALVVARVGTSAAKGAVKLRLGRQAAILRRLLGRHRGAFPPAGVVRLWLELLAGTTAMQGPFAVAAVPGLEGVAREQFGALTPLRAHADAAGALAAVRAGEATVAVLPLPGTAGGAWWPALLPGAGAAGMLPGAAGAAEAALHVVARLPLWRARPEGAPAGQAVVVAAVAPDPSGEDHSLLVLCAGAEAAEAALRAAGIEAVAPLAAAAGPMSGVCAGAPLVLAPLVLAPLVLAPLVLATVRGFVAPADARLRALAALSPVVVGAHAVPFDPSSVAGEQP